VVLKRFDEREESVKTEVLLCCRHLLQSSAITKVAWALPDYACAL
jgi:hypothetical protein